MTYLMTPYDRSLEFILNRGIKKQDRTGVGSLSIAGLQNKYPLNTGTFPIITKRKMFPKSVFAELIWFISGSTNNNDLVNLGCKFWSRWCDENDPKYRELRERFNYKPGEFGPIYGYQLRSFGGNYPHFDGFDQLAWMIGILKNSPYGSDGRRCLFSLWNPNDLKKMALPPCHYTYQAIVDGDGGLTGILTQRSCDWFIGVPANIQFYSAFTIMLAHRTGFFAREFVHNTNDCHIYLNQIPFVEEYLSRTEQPDSPELYIEPQESIFHYRPDHFHLSNYNPLEPINAPVLV